MDNIDNEYEITVRTKIIGDNHGMQFRARVDLPDGRVFTRLSSVFDISDPPAVRVVMAEFWLPAVMSAFRAAMNELTKDTDHV